MSAQTPVGATPIAVALYSLKTEIEKDFLGVLDRLAEVGFLGVELDGLYGLQPDQLRSHLDSLGMDVTSSQFDPSPSNLADALDEQEAIGSKLLVSDFGPENFVSRKALAGAVNEFNEAAAAARERGMTLGYHNHWWEFTPSPFGECPMVTLAEMLDQDVFFEIDIYYVASAWRETEVNDPATTMPRLGNRPRLVHVKDGPCTIADSTDGAVDVGGKLMDPSTAIGAGAVEVGPILAALPDVEWHIVEADFCVDNVLDLMAVSYRYLTERGLSRGSK